MYVFMMRPEPLAVVIVGRTNLGTPFCLTVDFETLGEKDEGLRETVTLRERDSMNKSA